MNNFPSQPTCCSNRKSRKAFLCYCFYKCLKVIDSIHILIMASANNEVSQHRNIHFLSMPGILSLTFEQKHCNFTQYLYILGTSKHSQMLEPWLLKSHGKLVSLKRIIMDVMYLFSQSGSWVLILQIRASSLQNLKTHFPFSFWNLHNFL